MHCKARVYLASLLPTCLLLIYICYFGLNSVIAEGADNLLVKKDIAVTLKADLVQYDEASGSVIASGNVYIFANDYVLKADVLRYDISTDTVTARGNIIINDGTGRLVFGERAVFKDKLQQGIIDEFVLRAPNNFLLVALVARRDGAQKISLHKAGFTPCAIRCVGQPIWKIRAIDTYVDYDKGKVVYHNAFFEVFGVPVMFIPYFSHPTPNAKAQSGILMPGIKKAEFMLPVYFRPKSNIDLTLSPRFAKKYVITEGEFRHLLGYGSYTINGSYGNPSYRKGDKIYGSRRYHMFARGDFSSHDIHYGFDVNRASDKAYLTNYFEIYDSFLESKLYVNKVDKGDYFALEGYSFKGFRREDQSNNTPFVFPRIRMQKLVEIDDDETTFLTIKNEVLGYNENYQTQLARDYLELKLSKNIITHHGFLFNFNLSNRSDFYWLSKSNPVTQNEYNSFLHRQIPEGGVKWLYPLIRGFDNNVSMKLEPIIAVTVGRKYSKTYNKFVIVDVSRYELSEYNIFDANRFNGVDYHEYGERLSYGINGSLFSNVYYFDAFLGQLIYNDNPVAKSNADCVGNVSLDIANRISLYYRFSRDKKLNFLRDELGTRVNHGNLSVNVAFSSLNDVARYYPESKNDFPGNKISQVNLGAVYQITDAINFEVGSRLDITSKIKLMQRSIKVTYFIDCVSISGKVYDDFTNDRSRGIKKQRSQSFAIGFKVLNM